MKPVHKSMLLFLLGCVPARLLLVHIARTRPEWLPTLGLLALLPAVGFLWIYATNSRKTGAETFGRPIWWNNMRPIHAMLYALFAFMALSRVRQAWTVLALDVFLGICAFGIHHLDL